MKIKTGDVVTFGNNQDKLSVQTIRSDNNLWKSLTDYQTINTMKPVVRAPLEAFDDAMLIMEMLRRGYAVAKMPAADLAVELGKSE